MNKKVTKRYIYAIKYQPILKTSHKNVNLCDRKLEHSEKNHENVNLCDKKSHRIMKKSHGNVNLCNIKSPHSEKKPQKSKFS